MSSSSHSARRYYAFALFLRLIFALAPLSILHPDEWMQSVQPAAHLLISSSPSSQSQHHEQHPQLQQTWEWRWTCVNATYLAHEGRMDAVRIGSDSDGGGSSNAMNISFFSNLSSPSYPYTCPPSMHLQPPIRSCLTPYLIAGLPYQVYRWFTDLIPSSSSSSIFPTSSYLLFLLPRLHLFLQSLLFDYMLLYLIEYWYSSSHVITDSKEKKKEKSQSQITVAAAASISSSIFSSHLFSFSTLILSTRTFSNILESNLLFVCLICFTLGVKHQLVVIPLHARATILFSIVLTFGLFIRLSLLFWTIPICLAFVGLLSDSAYRIETLEELCKSYVYVGVVLVGIPVLLTAIIVIGLDSMYFGAVWICLQDGTTATTTCSTSLTSSLHILIQSFLSFRMPSLHGTFLLTPYTNYVYNSRPENTAHHGLHFRGTHLFVNMLILLGPVKYWRLLKKSWKVVKEVLGVNQKRKSEEKDKQLRKQENLESTITSSTSATNIQEQQEELNESSSSSSASSSLSQRALRARARSIKHQQQSTSSSSSHSSSTSEYNRSLAIYVAQHHPVWFTYFYSTPFSFDFLLICMIWSGVGLLSLIPHQEMRFLVPVAAMVECVVREEKEKEQQEMIDAGSEEMEKKGEKEEKSTSSSSAFRRRLPSILSFLHTFFVILLLGILHQGGLLRQWIRGGDDVTTSGNEVTLTRIYLHTYTTPSVFFLMNDDHQHENSNNNRVIIEAHNTEQLYSSVMNVVKKYREAIDKAQDNAPSTTSSTTSSELYHAVHLVMPGSVPFPHHTMRMILNELLPTTKNTATSRSHIQLQSNRCTIISNSIFPHLSLDEAPNFSRASTHPPRRASDDDSIHEGVVYLDESSSSSCDEFHTHASQLSLMEYVWRVPV